MCSCIHVRLIRLVECSETVSKRNITFREYLGAHKVVPVKAAQASCWVVWGESQVRCGASPYNVTFPRQKRRPTNWWRA
jgi:hypothetical protein